MHHEGMIVKGTNTVAAAGMLMPAWGPSLAQMNEIASLIVAGLSAAWLVIQIIGYLRRASK